MIIDHADYDSPWKEMLELYFQEFMAFFFPEIATEIEWEAGYEFLDKELQQVVRDADLGRRIADKLAQRLAEATLGLYSYRSARVLRNGVRRADVCL